MTGDEAEHHGDRTWAEANVKLLRLLSRSEASVDFNCSRSGRVCIEIKSEQVTEKPIPLGTVPAVTQTIVAAIEEKALFGCGRYSGDRMKGPCEYKKIWS